SAGIAGAGCARVCRAPEKPWNPRRTLSGTSSRGPLQPEVETYMPALTSETHPIRVDFIPDDAELGPGRLGMTFAPGKKAYGIAGKWDRDLDMDLARLVREYDARVLVSLLADHEYEKYGIAGLESAADRHG